MSTAGTSPSVQLAHGASSSSASKEAGDGLRSENAIGVGVADLLVERLLQVPGIRVIERRRLDLVASERRLAAEDSGRLRGTTRDGSSAPLLQARYIITGSVTRFGTEERRGLGGLGGGFGLGALGIKRPKTQVALTARVIDATTGEIMASMTGTGVSTKGGAVLVGGIGGGVGGGVAITSSEFRASALGEATDRAITALVEQLAAQRARWQ
jgi:curli biogenesis system outer membrane secretion channel CsgG